MPGKEGTKRGHGKGSLGIGSADVEMTSRIFWIYRLGLAHREELLVETLRHGEAQRCEVPAQHFTKADGAAKPDAGLPPFGHGSAYPFAIEAAIARIDQNMQANMGCRQIGRASCRERVGQSV